MLVGDCCAFASASGEQGCVHHGGAMVARVASQHGLRTHSQTDLIQLTNSSSQNSPRVSAFTDVRMTDEFWISIAGVKRAKFA